MLCMSPSAVERSSVASYHAAVSLISPSTKGRPEVLPKVVDCPDVTCVYHRRNYGLAGPRKATSPMLKVLDAHDGSTWTIYGLRAAIPAVSIASL